MRWTASSAAPKTPASSATDVNGAELMQLVSPMCINATLSEDQSNRLLNMILDGLRHPS